MVLPGQEPRLKPQKTFSKEFMQRHNIPTARFEKFSDYEIAVNTLESIKYPIVIKASGLAAGKGVFLPQSRLEAQKILQDIMQKKVFGEAGNEVIIEERLEGEEVSLLAFSDGYSISPMPPAQDHKRLLDNDEGTQYRRNGYLCSCTNLQSGICLNPSVKIYCSQQLMVCAKKEFFISEFLYAGLILTKEGPQSIGI